MAPHSATDKPANPNEHLIIPQWINEEYFLPILKKYIKNFSKITKFFKVAATPPGENYTSIMVRVFIDIETKDGSNQKVSYILKTSLVNNSKGSEFLNGLHVFPREKEMYNNHLQNFMALYKAAGVDLQFGPACLQVDETPEGITLVMEDLTKRNFANMDRLKGFDMAHMKSVLRKLAELHAVSARYCELNGPYDGKFHLSYYNESNRKFFKTLSSTRQNLMPRAMHEWKLENAEYYIKKLPHPDASFNEGMRINTVDPQEFNVLNHGDCWVNNIMFKHDEKGNVNETLFIDFQLSKWGSPAQDLWYLIITSAALDIKVKKFDHFIYIYHQRLVECLKLLGYTKKIPTLKELHIALIKRGYFGVTTAHSVMSIVLLPSNKDANIENYVKADKAGTEFAYQRLTTPCYAKAMCELVPFFDRKGFYDIE